MDARFAQAELFLKLLFEDACSEGLYFLIHCLPSRRSRFFNRVDAEVIKYCFHECDVCKQNVYAGMGLLREPVKGGGRGKSADVAAIVGLFGDFDIKKSPDDTLHPETVEGALELAKIGPIDTSCYVLSGSGLHGYWLFNEPWIFADSNEHAEADALVKRVNNTHLALARSKGYEVDFIKDLVRVFRVPGTLNYKLVDDVKPVELVCPVGEVPRYERDDFEPYLVDPASLGHPQVGQHAETVEYFTLDPQASLDPEKLQLAFQADDGFEDTWCMRRVKEFGSDVSRYDQSIANVLIDAGWSDEDVAVAITHFRREIAAKPKVDHKGRLRLDYYQQTILKAKNASATRKGHKAIESGALLSSMSGPLLDPKTGKSNVDEATRSKVLEEIRSVIRVDIHRWVQVGLDDPTFYLITKEGQKLVIGGDNDFEKPHLFRRKLRNHFGVIVPASVSKSWESVVSHLTAVRELDVADEPTKADRIVSAVNTYIVVRHTLEGEGAGGRAARSRTPFIENGSVYVNFNDFDQWHTDKKLRIYQGPNEGRTLFKMAGAEPKRVTATGAGLDHSNRPKPRYWKFPKDALSDSGRIRKLFEGVQTPDTLGDELD